MGLDDENPGQKVMVGGKEMALEIANGHNPVVTGM